MKAPPARLSASTVSPVVASVSNERCFVSVEEACEHVGIERTTFYNLISSGEIVAKKCGRRTLIDRSSLDAWAARLPQFALSEPAAARRLK